MGAAKKDPGAWHLPTIACLCPVLDTQISSQETSAHLVSDAQAPMVLRDVDLTLSSMNYKGIRTQAAETRCLLERPRFRTDPQRLLLRQWSPGLLVTSLSPSFSCVCLAWK